MYTSPFLCNALCSLFNLKWLTRTHRSPSISPSPQFSRRFSFLGVGMPYFHPYQIYAWSRIAQRMACESLQERSYSAKGLRAARHWSARPSGYRQPGTLRSCKLAYPAPGGRVRAPRVTTNSPLHPPRHPLTAPATLSATPSSAPSPPPPFLNAHTPLTAPAPPSPPTHPSPPPPLPHRPRHPLTAPARTRSVSPLRLPEVRCLSTSTYSWASPGHSPLESLEERSLLTVT